MAVIRRALAYSFLGANTVTVIQFASTLIIARLLTPEQLGIYSVAAVFIGIAAVLRDFGVASYLIQIEELTEEIERAAFGLIILMALALGSLILGFSSLIAEFYRDPRVGDVLTVLAINFFVTPLGSITLTVARRQMRFRALAAINVLSTCAAVSFSITLISLGLGPVGLAWGAVAGTIATFLMSLLLRRRNRPLMPTLRNSRKIASFGTVSATSSILSLLNVSASDVILGRILGLEAVGLFNRATSLTRFVTTGLGSALNPVLLPWLSQLRREKHDPRVTYRKIVERTTGITWPIFAFVAVFSDEIVLILFGDKWGQSAALIPYICMSACFSSACSVCQPLYLSLGRPSASLVVQSINLPFKIGGVVFFAQYGLEAVAAAWPWLGCIGAATHQVMIRYLAGIRLMDTLAATRSSAFLGLTALVAATLSGSLMPFDANVLLVVGAGLICTAIAVVATGLLVNHALIGEAKSLGSKIRERMR